MRPDIEVDGGGIATPEVRRTSSPAIRAAKTASTKQVSLIPPGPIADSHGQVTQPMATENPSLSILVGGRFWSWCGWPVGHQAPLYLRKFLSQNVPVVILLNMCWPISAEQISSTREAAEGKSV
jgi:hypothetical protein